MAKEKKHDVIPYGDEVRFFVDEQAGTAVPVWIGRPDYSKGWANVRVGPYTVKARTGQEFGAQGDLLKEHYPGHTKQVSFYHDLSYHSPLNQGTAGKAKTYGTNPYMVDFSLYTPVKSYRLLYPVKTSAPGSFGKERNKVTTYEWEYIVNNWIPMGKGGPIMWEVKHVIHHADGLEKILYRSGRIDNADEALAKFNTLVVAAGGKGYRLTGKGGADIVAQSMKRLSGRVQRRTGRKRSRSGASSTGLRQLR